MSGSARAGRGAELGMAAHLVEQGVLSHLDHELARALLEIAGESSEEVALGAAFASWAIARGHVCVDLKRLRTRRFHDEAGEALPGIELPAHEAWISALTASKLVAVDPVEPGEQEPLSPRPLVLAGGTRLYLSRYFDYERKLAAALLGKSRVLFGDLDGALLSRGLEALFPQATAGTDGQRRAALLATMRGLSVISGGPGTGKTYSVAKVLGLLQEQALGREQAPLRILLLAPTGKAAARLGEAIGQSLAALPEELRGLIPAQAATLHRALGYQRSRPTHFRHDRENPLPADVVVVDEASMVDLALMTKLVDAVHPNARLILLGDKDQLASVEAGAILGDIYGGNPNDGYSCGMAERALELTGGTLPVSPTRPDAGLHDCMVHLTHVHRFAGSGAIAALAAAVRAGDQAAAFAALDAPGDEIVLCPVEPGASLETVFGRLVVERFAGLGSALLADKLEILASFRFLCAHRRGAFGVHALNRFVADHLTASGVLEARADWYDGRPVLITANDYSLELFNGDVGVISAAPTAAAGDEPPRSLVACFPGTGGEGVRSFAPGQLPPHETVFAMSVHKAQGSELSEVALVLPERVSPVLTRELIYTGITRAKQKVRIYGSREVLAQAIEARVERASGLGNALWGTPRG